MIVERIKRTSDRGGDTAYLELHDGEFVWHRVNEYDTWEEAEDKATKMTEIEATLAVRICQMMSSEYEFRTKGE